jgi:hypothetical protein
MDMATNAKWYHIVTLKIRVSRISYISVDKATRNKPAKVPRPAVFSTDIWLLRIDRQT